MSIQQRKIKATGGGSSASGVGVQQLAVPKNNLGSSASSLAKSLGVLMDTSLSPHEQAQLDKASSDEYRKLEGSLQGKSEDEQDRLRTEHRAKFTEANPKGFIENMLNKPNPRLQGYDDATATSMNYTTQDAINQLQKNFRPEDDVTFRTNALIEMYESQQAKAEGLSPEVARQWRESTESHFENAYAKVRDDADALQKAEAMGVVENATDLELTHMTGVDLTDKDASLEASNEVSRSLNTIADDGTEVLDPTMVKKMFGSIQGMRAKLKVQNPQLSKDQLNTMVNEKYKWVAQMYNKPELFDALMDETNGSGQTGRSLYAKYAQDTANALQVEHAKKQTMLVNKHEGEVTKNSKAVADGIIQGYTDDTILAEGGDTEAEARLGTKYTTADELLNKYPNMRASDISRILGTESSNRILHRKYVATAQTHTANTTMLTASRNIASIKDIHQFNFNNRHAGTDHQKLLNARYNAFQESEKGKTDAQKLSTKRVIDHIISRPKSELESSLKLALEDHSATLDLQTNARKVFDDFATPAYQKLLNEGVQGWFEKVDSAQPVTQEEYDELRKDYMENNFQPIIDNYTSQLKTFGRKLSQLAPEADTDSKPQVNSDMNFDETKDVTLAGDEAKTTEAPNLLEQAEEKRVAKQAEAIQKFKKEKPTEYFYTALPQAGKQGVARMVEELPDRIDELVTAGKTDGTSVNPWDVMTTLAEDMYSANPELLANDPEGVLEDLGLVVAEVVQRHQEGSDSRVRNLNNEAFNLDAFDRDSKLDIESFDMSPLIRGTLLGNRFTEPDGSGIYESKIRFQELLNRIKTQ